MTKQSAVYERSSKCVPHFNINVSIGKDKTSEVKIYYS